MILNRKSIKKTSRVSLVIAVAVIGTVAVAMQTQGYQIEHITSGGVEMCKVGFVELFVSLLW